LSILAGDDREASGGPLSQFLAQVIDLRILGRGQQRPELLFGQQGPRFQVLLRALQIELPQRGDGIQGHHRQKDQHQQAGGVELPEQASFVHGSPLAWPLIRSGR
jgi:hypothetical protein